MLALRAEARMNLRKIKATLALLAAHATELPPVTYRVTRQVTHLTAGKR
jgi:hypothetical protein